MRTSDLVRGTAGLVGHGAVDGVRSGSIAVQLVNKHPVATLIGFMVVLVVLWIAAHVVMAEVIP
jgi:hypothetical protein